MSQFVILIFKKSLGCWAKFPWNTCFKLESAVVGMVSKLSRTGKGFISQLLISSVSICSYVCLYMLMLPLHSLSPIQARESISLQSLASRQALLSLGCRAPLFQRSPLPLLSSCSVNMPLTGVLAHQPSSTQRCSQPALLEIASSLGFQHVWGIALLILPPYFLIGSRSDAVLQICLH